MTVKSMTASEIAKKVVNKEAFFIVDVRNEDVFKDWKIEGEKIGYLNIPYFDLLDGVEEDNEQASAGSRHCRGLCKRRLIDHDRRDDC